MHVAHHADYGDLRLVDGEALANRIAVRPEALRGRRADDGDGQPVLAVRFIKAAALHQPDAHRAEVAGRCGPIIGGRRDVRRQTANHEAARAVARQER